jgi:Single Cache domain 2
MPRHLAFLIACAAALAMFRPASGAETQFATADQAKAMLEKAVTAMKQDEAKALEMFATGEGGFKEKDLYVFCANAADGILTVHPTNKGKDLRDIKGKHGDPFGQVIMQTAAEGTIKETTYGRALARMRPSRRGPTTPRWEIRFAVSAITKSERRPEDAQRVAKRETIAGVR